ncbi:MAG: ATP-binding protein [Pyrinomonadaceae bacterium]
MADLLETNDGTYFIATSGGLAVFNPLGKAYRWNILSGGLERSGSEPPLFTTYFPPTLTDTNSSKSILSLGQRSDGSIYAGTPGGLFRFEQKGEEWQFTRVRLDNTDKDQITVNFLHTDSQGSLWIAAANAIYRMASDGQIKKVHELGGNWIFEDQNGRIWLDGGGNEIGIRVYNYSAESDVPALLATYTAKDGLPNLIFTNAVAQTLDGQIYVSSGGILCKFNETQEKGETKFERLSNPGLMAGQGTIDQSGNLWIATLGKGAWKHTPGGFNVFDDRDGIPNELITSIFGNENNEVFLTVDDGTIVYGKDGKFESVIPSGMTARSWGRGFLDIQVADHSWWVPALDGLRHYPAVREVADLAQTRPATVYSVSGQASDKTVFNVFESSSRDIWFSTLAGRSSVYQLDRETGRISGFPPDSGLPGAGSAVSFGEDASGNIWLGFYFGELARYKDGKFRLFSAEDGFPRGSVSDIVTDKRGRVWLATSSRGLFRIDEPDSDTPVFTNFSTANGLSSNQTNCLAQDNVGRIYIGTGLGINRIDPETQRIKIYTHADGLPGNQISHCYSDNVGVLWASSNNSLIRLAPRLEEPDQPPPIFIDAISVNGIERGISALGETELVGIELAPDERQIKIQFFGLSFSTGNVLRYQYKLGEQEWSIPDVNRTIDLNLAAGRYTISVQAVSAEGVVSETPATVSITILRPIWQRWWFLAISAMLIGIAILMIVRSRSAKRKHAEAAREERIAELQRVRTRIANDLHDDIGSSLTQIAVLSEVARERSALMANGDLQLPLERIKTVSKDLVATMADVVWAINPKKDFLHDLVQRMRRFGSDVFTGRNIRFEFHTPEDQDHHALGANTRRELLAIFKEAVNNIARHSECTVAKVDFSTDGDLLILRISDNGKGFDMSQVLTTDFSPENGGNGLINIRRRAQELGGDCEIKSDMGGGTNIVVRIPL